MACTSFCVNGTLLIKMRSKVVSSHLLCKCSIIELYYTEMMVIYTCLSDIYYFNFHITSHQYQ